MKIKESEKINKYMDLAWELKKQTVEHEGDSNTNCSWSTWNDPQKLAKEIREIENQRKIETV